MLFGRDAERRAIDQVLDAAEDGAAGALVICGEAGMGKSELCRYTVAAVEARGAWTLLSASGIEAESTIAFAALFDLCRPLLEVAGELPDPQRQALEVALGIGGASGAESLMVAAGLLSLLGTASERGPVAVVVDDLQWVDPSSASALAFVVRRLSAERVAVVLTRRGTDPGRDLAGLPSLVLTGLGASAVAAYLEHLTGVRVAPGVARRLGDATAGNPLVLREVVRSLTPSQLQGLVPLPEPLPLGEQVRTVFSGRLDALEVGVRRALVVAAAAGNAGLDAVRASCRHLGIDPAALDAGEELGLVRLSAGRIEFDHPVARSAVYHGASPVEQRAAHAALAAELATDPERRIRHLAAASVDPDEAVASELEAAADRSRSRAGYAEAAELSERSAMLTVDPQRAVRRLAQAALDRQLGGQPARALALCAEALQHTSDPAVRAELHLFRGHLESWSGDQAAGFATLCQGAGEAGEAAPAPAALMLGSAAMIQAQRGRLADSYELARRSHDVGAVAGGLPSTVSRAVLAEAVTLIGRGREVRPNVERCAEELRRSPPFDVAHQLGLFVTVQVLTTDEEYERARDLDLWAIELARGRGAPGILPFPLAALADIEYRLGRWPAALAAATEAVDLSRVTGTPLQLSHSLAVTARVLAALGRDDECRAHVAEARELAASLGVDSILTYADAALGLLELGRGEFALAASHLEQAWSLAVAHGLGEPGVIPFGPDLVEALLRSGDRSRAEEALEWFEGQADATERAWARSAAARCRGMLAAAGDFEEWFSAAAVLERERPVPFTRARNLLALGECRRRAGRRNEAREPLREAERVLGALGARSFAERVRAELRATGLRRRGRATGPLDALTPRELRVAYAVAAGATNKEAAAELFISPKTVENHLGRIFAKLGVRTRTELAHLLLSGQPPVGP